MLHHRVHESWGRRINRGPDRSHGGRGLKPWLDWPRHRPTPLSYFGRRRNWVPLVVDRVSEAHMARATRHRVDCRTKRHAVRQIGLFDRENSVRGVGVLDGRRGSGSAQARGLVGARPPMTASQGGSAPPGTGIGPTASACERASDALWAGWPIRRMPRYRRLTRPPPCRSRNRVSSGANAIPLAASGSLQLPLAARPGSARRGALGAFPASSSRSPLSAREAAR